MKIFVTIFLALFLSAYLFAQVPQKMTYQAILRNNNNKLVLGLKVSMRISIIKGSAAGPLVYQETQTPFTNSNGLITIEIGSGLPVIGRFDTINWGTSAYYIKTETDPTGGTNYTITGSSQLISVPYALYAKTSAGGFSGDYNDLKNKPSYFNGTWASLTGVPTFSTVALSKNYNDLINKPTLFNGTWGSLTAKPTFATVANSGSYSDLTNKPKLWDSSWASINGKPANFLTLSAMPSKGQMIYYNGTKWDTTSKGTDGQYLAIQNNIPTWLPKYYTGQRYGGGIIAYIDSSGLHGFIVSSVDISSGTAWSNVNSTVIGPTGESLWDGSSNSTAIIAQAGHTSSASLFCKIYSGGGYNDWYLPSVDQCVKLNLAKKEIDKAAGSGGLNGWYWTSTEINNVGAYSYSFMNSLSNGQTKGTMNRVRAVRNF